VEHPVTELTTGVDLVREQIRRAAGEPLSFAQEQMRHCGHAMQFRIFAEDFARNFMPSPGVVGDVELSTRDGLRVDSGSRSGSTVTVHYDPLLAKLAVWGQDRAEALARAWWALSALQIEGVPTDARPPSAGAGDARVPGRRRPHEDPRGRMAAALPRR